MASTAFAREKLVVLELSTSDDASSKTARLVQEQVATELMSLERYDIIGQSDITALLGLERQKQLLGCSDEASSCMAELSGALGARWLVMGTLGRAGTKLRFDLKLVDSAASKTVARSGRVLANDDELFAAVPEMVRALVGVTAPRLPIAPLIVGGVGAVAAVIGSVLLGTAVSANQTLNRERAGIAVSSAQAQLKEQQLSYWAGLGVLAAGGAALVGGLVWFFVAPVEPPASAWLGVGPSGVEVRW